MDIDAAKFDKVARSLFAPIYPLIAEQILARSGITTGCCLDLGCGGGYLGIELARRSELALVFLDQSVDMLDIVRRNLVANQMEGRARTILADVQQIPLPDASVNLAISRGSVFFWKNLARAFGEIHRVLAPGGMSYIGGGFGSAALREQITLQMKGGNGPGGMPFREKVERNLGQQTRQKFIKALQEAHVANYDMVNNEEEGLWIVMYKED